jgi:hypothetical protein
VLYRFINLMHSDVLSLFYVNNSSKVNIKNNRLSNSFSKVSVSKRVIVSIDRDAVKRKVGLL